MVMKFVYYHHFQRFHLISRLDYHFQLTLFCRLLTLNLLSKELYLRLQLLSTKNSNLCFVIGGPDGISEELKQKSSMKWSLTNLTLPHGLAKIVFIEQIYRLWTLESHHPYHRY